jgi:hypothetical protein
MSGKGSGRRPMNIGRKTFDDNWDTIFSKKKKVSVTDISVDDISIEVEYDHNEEDVGPYSKISEISLESDGTHHEYGYADDNLVTIENIDLDTTLDPDITINFEME